MTQSAVVMNRITSYFKPKAGNIHASNSTDESVTQAGAMELRNSPPQRNSNHEQPRFENADQILPDNPPLDIPNAHFSYPHGDFRNATAEEINDIKCDVMANYLHAQQEERLWTAGEEGEGVVLKKSRGEYTCAPRDLAEEHGGFYRGIEALNVKVAMTVNTRMIKILLHSNQKPWIEIDGGLRIQVLPDASGLARCQKHQFAAFVSSSGLLVVWDDHPNRILDRIARLEVSLMTTIWGADSAFPVEQAPKEKQQAVDQDRDVEGQEEDEPRSLMLYQPLLTALTIIMCLTVLGVGWKQIAIQIVLDHNWYRISFIACYIPQAWLALFFFQAMVYDMFQLIGPMGQLHKNTKTFSGMAPRRIGRDKGPLPHVTIQCPVYKEGLHAVIEPTIRSVKAAISTYELQGGTANIFVNDDGMQLISEVEARERQDFYDEHNIGWVARPKHNPNPSSGEVGFNRRGKFKKASNMNYALWISQSVEDKLDKIGRTASWSNEQEAAVYKGALEETVTEDGGRTWADGNVRIGDFILLIDSDTRVPTDCLLDAVSEMVASPQVAIMQYSSGVMNVTSSFFEKGVTFFTNLVYTQIRFTVSNGDVAPFVGHNAVLRWSALQEIAYDCPFDSREKYWSEDTVSEDFDMALRLQSNGYIVRLAAYQGDGFKEGVSLTVYDELARWEKYAYGCSELIFHPLIQWPTRGPFTRLFRNFITSSMGMHSKITIMSYVGTYYALGSAWALTLLNYLVIGWFNGHLDHYYMDSFRVFFASVVIFWGLGNVGLAALRYRNKEKSFFPALWENFKWVPMFAIFLGGVSVHVSQAILSHMFSVDMSWGATAKEVENVSFFEEIPRVLKRFKWTFAFCVVLAAAMITMAFLPAVGNLVFWRIDSFIACFPLANLLICHFLLPIALNPNLMRFTW